MWSRRYCSSCVFFDAWRSTRRGRRGGTRPLRANRASATLYTGIGRGGQKRRGQEALALVVVVVEVGVVMVVSVVVVAVLCVLNKGKSGKCNHSFQTQLRSRIFSKY